MQLESDVVLIGTGVAPLVAASRLVANDKKVVVLNPDWDFFGEDSEFPFSPVFPGESSDHSIQQIHRQSPEKIVEMLRPDFPGAVEFLPQITGKQDEAYYDREAPHVRQRSLLMIRSKRRVKVPKFQEAWEALENNLSLWEEKGVSARALSGIQAAAYFPGYNIQRAEEEEFPTKGISVPKMVDVDVDRFRYGLLEYIRDRVGPDHFHCSVSQITFNETGLTFYADGNRVQVNLKEGVLAFWTPSLHNWISGLKRVDGAEAGASPKTFRVCEHWSLTSRDPLESKHIGVYEDLVVWPSVEGPDHPENVSRELSVLRVGRDQNVSELDGLVRDLGWMSADSFEDLSSLCRNFLRWDKFSINRVKTRTVFHRWDKPSKLVNLSHGHFMSSVVPCSDGAIYDIVETARNAALRYL